MPANHHIDNKAKLIVTTWEDEASDIEFIAALKRYQNDIQNHPDYIKYNEVVDFTNVKGIKLTAEGIRNIGLIASATDHNEVNRKLAFIVHSNFAYGLTRMYVTYRSLSKKANKEIRVFKTEKDALEWLNN